MPEYTVAVADLARFCHRSGDIDHRFSPSPSGPEGIAGHQRLYRQRPASYAPEYPVEYRREFAGLTLVLRGRADGYDSTEGLVEEIKTCRVAPDAVPPAVQDLHQAQGRLYAAMIARAEERPGLDVRVTWLNIDSDDEHSRVEHFSRAALDEFLDDSLRRFGDWLAQLAHMRSERNCSIETLEFPLGEFRPGQRDIAELTYKCIDQGGQLQLEAPTGIGKTAAVLFPALKALARDKHERLVFVTAKTVGRLAAESTLAACSAAGYRGTCLSLTAKDSACLSPGKACHGEECPFARGYYDRLPLAMGAALEQRTLTRDNLEILARQHDVCPYELAQDLLPWMDIVIGDIHYVYSLTPRLGHLMEGDGGRWTILLDEAHNLPARARDMFSAQLSKGRLMAVKRASDGAVGKALAAINRQFLALARCEWQETDFHCSEALPEAFIGSLHKLVAAVGERLAQDPAFLQGQPLLLEFYFDVLQLLRVSEQWDTDYRCELYRGAGAQSLRLKLNCLDPSRLLAGRQDRAHALVAFSATLSPQQWSRTALGMNEDAVFHRAVSPFDPQQLQVTLATDISTRYRDREATLPQLAERVAEWLARHDGNCIVYFPSYTYLGQVAERIGDLPGRTLWRQRPEMSEQERGELFDLLAAQRDLAAFCILGGIFAEGIDLPGEQLCSVVIVGVGMPQVNRDTRQLQAFYHEHYGAGFEYAFLYPGMQRVDQALGRVVRRREDRGDALLIDSRYRERQYRDLLPPWWDYGTT